MIVLDTTAALALAAGHGTLYRLADAANREPGRALIVPALCLIAAEEQREGAGNAVLGIPGVAVDALDTVGAMAVAMLGRSGFSHDIAHVMHSASPGAHRISEDIIVTRDPDAYPPGWIAVGYDDPDLKL